MGRARHACRGAEYGFVAALIGIVNDCDGLLSDALAGAVDPGCQDEPTRDALPLRGHLDDLAVAVPGLPAWDYASDVLGLPAVLASSSSASSSKRIAKWMSRRRT